MEPYDGIGCSIRLGGQDIPTPAICASVIDENLDSMRKSIAKAKSLGADLVELRIDKLDDFSGWKNLLETEEPNIVTNRSRKEGGYFKGMESERVEALLEAIDMEVSGVDIELSTSEDLRDSVIDKARGKNTSVIMSHHDFEKVPPEEKLMDKAEQMNNSGCEFIKIVGFSNNSQDSLNILQFLIKSQKEFETPIVAFAMGEKGTLTRLTAPLLGSPITYASVEEKAAPGQLDVTAVRKILDKYK